MQRQWKRLHLPLILVGLLLGGVLEAQDSEPVYVGARVCATCHEGASMGDQYSKWLLARHSRAYTSLSLPEALEIADLSGVTEEPQEAPLCLGCHATGAEVEEWERDPTFHIEDGVQCEKCHGPGSEYMAAEIMTNPEAAHEAGLLKPTRSTCMICHNEKGSHVAVTKKPRLDIDEAWQRIAHPTPEKPEYFPREIPGGIGTPQRATPQYVGARSCATCHRSAEMGFQYSRWRASAHARAYATLSTAAAREIADAQGLEGDPRQSQECLKCHVTGGADLAQALGSFTIDEGVGCEACHGPGSLYQPEAIMLDSIASADAGLRMGNEATCNQCHEDAHGAPFDYASAWEEIAHPNEPRDFPQQVRYKTPLNLAVTPDGRELYVACEASDSVIVIDVARRQKVAEIPVGGQPNDVTFDREGQRAFVTNRLDDSVTEIDTTRRQIVRSAAVGDEPHGVLLNRSENLLYVLNTSEDSISVLDAETLEEEKRLPASRNPWSLALSPDGSQMVVTNTLSRLVGFREPSLSEVTSLDARTGVVTDRLEIPGANLLQGIAWHPSGDFALFTLNRTKNLVPMTRLLQGWTITNGIGIAWRDGRVDQLLLDNPGMAFPDPSDVAISPDGRRALVSSSGSDRLALLDLEKLIEIVSSASDRERKEILPNHLGRSTEFVMGHLATGKSPRGIVFSPDGSEAYVANALDDSVTIIDTERATATAVVDLGGPEVITKKRFGEQVFHSANIAFHRQFSCHTCHPDGHVDGITYDIEPDGVGVSPVDNRTLRGILDTAPFKWEGTNPNLQRQCGPRLAVFFTRIEPFTPDELEAIEYYIATIPRPPNRYRPLGAELTPAQRRGKAIFERSYDNSGQEIPPDRRCINCHPPPLYTNRQVVDVGTKMQFDRESEFDVPHLNNIYDSAPYLHNGIAATLEEIWTVYNPQDMHGVTNDLTKDQLNDLMEYIKTF